MDDSCVVCAEALEWVAYGPCGHKEVCSTCVIRLRFVCGDHRCCICKSEATIIFATKALGDYTRMATDFSDFPSNPAEGRSGSFWYHKATQVYFDDLNHYKMIKAMCKLSCNVCDRKEEKRKAGSRRRNEFKNVEQLKNHLFDRHSLFMCSLCLEGRKVFICEQKLYSREQLDQHVKTGDSDVDGSETERAGFTGHPMCEFCQVPFYGDHELYMHMSTEHYACHICQRRHPGQYEYYRNYDEMEVHFEQHHFLCEEGGCLAKKFVVFATESEMKRHYSMEHRERKSRSKRVTALQVPISFQYQHYDRDQQGRGRGSSSNSSERQLSLSIQCNQRLVGTSSGAELIPLSQEISETGMVTGPSESFSTVSSEFFPPLPVIPRRQNTQNGHGRSAQNTMAALFRANILNTSRSGQAANLASGSSSESKPPNFSPFLASSSCMSSNDLLGTHSGCALPRQAAVQKTLPTNNANALRDSSSNGLSHSSLNARSCQRKAEDVQCANKALVEKIHAALEFNKDKYSAFKGISLEYRKGLINTGEYLAYVCQFGLSHLVLDLARLCPDETKRRELVETYHFLMRGGDFREESSRNSNGKLKDKRRSEKGKEKCQDDGISVSKSALRSSNSADVVEEERVSLAKSKILCNEQPTLNSSSHIGSSKGKFEIRGGGNKARKKTSKFLRNRLGDDAAAAVSNQGDLVTNADVIREKRGSDKGNHDRVPVRGVWQNGGGLRLLAMSQTKPRKQ